MGEDILPGFESVYIRGVGPDVDGTIGQIMERDESGDEVEYVIDLEDHTITVTRDKLVTLEDAIGKLEALVADLDRWSDDAKERARNADETATKKKYYAREGTHYNAAKEIRDRILGSDGE